MSNFVLFALTQKGPKKSRLYENPAILLEIYGGAKPNSPLLRRGSDKVLLYPPPISQNRDFHKASFLVT
ncbi:MAG: hypothetical protein H6575_18840 [Lewinellaceae bacterium]|nr:hypothetical protein [Lewinellaceae bacterium]